MRYSINVTPLNEEGNLKGLATVVFADSFKITSIAILNNPEKDQNYVVMPRYKTSGKDENNNEIYKDICNPITKEFREALYGDILAAYEQVKNGKEIANPEPDPLFPEFSVKVTPYERANSSIRGMATIYFEDSFVVSNVTIHQGRENLFVAMPSYKTKKVDDDKKPIYQDVCYPVKKEFREKLYDTILETYKKEKEKQLSEVKEKAHKTSKKKTKERNIGELPFR